MSYQVFYRDKQHVFLNSSKVRGVQSVDFSYDVNASTIKSLGLDEYPVFAEGPQIGRVNISAYNLYTDPFISYTGASPASLYILKNKTDSNYNYSALTGYLNSYSSRCAVGEVPQIGASFTFYGPVGYIDRSTPGAHFSQIASSTETGIDLSYASRIEVQANGFNVENILSYEVNININRKEEYALNNNFPIRVNTNYPIECLISFTVSSSSYEAFTSRKFPFSKKETDISIIIKKMGGETINVYSFLQCLLISENINSSVDSKSTVTLTYRCLLSEKKELVKDNLVFYWDASHPKSNDQSNNRLRDLSFNKNDFPLTAGELDSSSLIFADGDGYISTSNNIYIGHSCSFCFVVKILQKNDNETQVLFSWGNSKFTIYSEGDPFLLTIDGDLNYLGSESLSYNEWKYYTLTLNEWGNEGKLYRNGVLVETFTYDNSPENNGIFYIGGEISNYNILGYIGKFAVYNKVLSAEEVAQNYNKMYLANQS